MTAPHRGRSRFVYGGVRFDVADPEGEFESAMAGLKAEDGSPCYAHVRVGIAVPDAIGLSLRPIRWKRVSSEVVVDALGLALSLTETSAGVFECSPRVSPSHPLGFRGIAETVATTIAELSHGVVFHTAAIVDRDRGVLFIGPSGAGKSTAATLVPGALEFSADRAAVVPRADGGYDVFPLRLVGTPSGLPLSSSAGRPLAAILDVRHDGQRLGVESMSRVRQLGRLRAAATTGGDALYQAVLLDRLETLARAVLVASVYTRLDSPLALPDFR
jgi:hypothetical protein